MEGTQVKKLHESTELIKSNPFFVAKEVLLEASSVGLQRYKVVTSTIQGERNTKNNQRDLFIEVLDAKKKVLIYALSPHPDLSALKDAMISNKNYDVSIKYFPEALTNVDQYTLAIFHQLPGANAQISSTIQLLNSFKIPAVFVVGNQTDIVALNAIQDAVQISGNTKNQNESQAVVNSAFSLFTMSDPLQSSIVKYPPLSVPFGNFKIDPTTSTFLYQKIGKVETNYPLWIFQDKVVRKLALLWAKDCGSGAWQILSTAIHF
ncbi:MAG: hypothetical protein IPH96_18350 [Saprospiraceae bacterium]|nr:hypothetical protein [Saprospiraceae bacterium]